MRPSDAHLHLYDLERSSPGSIDALIAERIAGSRRRLAASCHERAEYEACVTYGERGLDLAICFGIHPQLAVWDEAEYLAARAEAGSIAAIGECGFEFFGDRPEWTRAPENEKVQRGLFEFQLGLAKACALPLVIHQRRALDLVFAYAPELKALPAVVFHAWTGPLPEAQALLARGIRAYFSFGASILNGNRKAAASCAGLPESALLLETDAPYQAPRGQTPCRPEHIDLVLQAAAILRGIEPEALGERVEANFAAVFGPQRAGAAQARDPRGA